MPHLAACYRKKAGKAMGRPMLDKQASNCSVSSWPKPREAPITNHVVDWGISRHAPIPTRTWRYSPAPGPALTSAFRVGRSREAPRAGGGLAVGLIMGEDLFPGDGRGSAGDNRRGGWLRPHRAVP